MADEMNEKCAHPACACKRSSDSKYCSTFCSGEAETSDITCSCGHPCCATKEPVAVQG